RPPPPSSTLFPYTTLFRSKNMTFSDFIPPTLKTTVFGFIIGIVSCFQGMHARRGTEGVGRAATSSVVLSSLFVILADVVLVRLIDRKSTRLNSSHRTISYA